MTPRNACPQCNGNGKCAQCNGTGINGHLNEAEPKCRSCLGTGMCPQCEGTGRTYLPTAEILDIGLNKL
jgi:hypothetical protein